MIQKQLGMGGNISVSEWSKARRAAEAQAAYNAGG